MTPGARVAFACLALALAAAACREDAQVHGTVRQAGKGVPGVTIALECPGAPKLTTTTNATGDFRFEGVGAGVDDRCIVQTPTDNTWSAQSIATRCVQRDAKSALCIEALFAFSR